MNEIFIVERHIVLMNRAQAALPVRAFADPKAAESFRALLEQELGSLLERPVQVGSHPSHIQPLAVVLHHLGIRGVAHGFAPTGLQSGVIEDPGGPRIIM